MPTIVAICPYCRAGGVRAKDTTVGASATCPKCKSSFVLLPEDDLPDWVAQVPPDAAVFSAPSLDKPKAPPTEETHAVATTPDVTEPSPALSAEPAQRPKPAVVPALAHSFSPSVPPDTGLVIALAAIILVGPAVLASQLPYGRIIAIALTATGSVVGLLCLGAEGQARLAGGLAAACHFVALVVLLFLPSWLNLDPWHGAAKVEHHGPAVIDNATGLTTPQSPNDWLDASKVSWQSEDVRVTLRGVALGPVELFGPNGAKRTTKEPYLQLVLQVKNSSVERDVPLSGWATEGTDGIDVADANGKALAPAAFEAGWAPVHGRQLQQAIMGHPADVRLIFTAPPPKTEFVRVRLSGSAFGSADEIRFQASLPPFPVRHGP